MDIFEELGLHRYINAQDTFTTYGASCMPAASLRAMREIASSCVELAEVQAKTGDALAKLTHNEGAYISNGAAGKDFPYPAGDHRPAVRGCHAGRPAQHV